EDFGEGDLRHRRTRETLRHQTTSLGTPWPPSNLDQHSQIVASVGPGSREAKEFRAKLSGDEEFLEFADALDRLHQNLRKKRNKEIEK
ncbi:MAG: hypothetical protein ACKOAU_14230, partial [Pirellula sp.]